MLKQWCFLVNVIFCALGINLDILYILIHVKIHYGMANINESISENSGYCVMSKSVHSHIGIQGTFVDCTKL